MDSIETQLTQLNTIKSDIKAAIVAKGVSGVTDDFKTYASKIQSITTGGSSNKSLMQILTEEKACVIENIGADNMSFRSVTAADEEDFDWMTCAIAIYQNGTMCLISIISWWMYESDTKTDTGTKMSNGDFDNYMQSVSGVNATSGSYLSPCAAKQVSLGTLPQCHYITQLEGVALANTQTNAKNIIKTHAKDLGIASYTLSPYCDNNAAVYLQTQWFGGFGATALSSSAKFTATGTTKIGRFIVSMIPDEWFAK